MRKVLIVVDMQNDFVSGSLGSPEAQAIVPNVVNKIQEYPREDVYFTLDTHTNCYLDSLEGKYLPIQHCVRATAGWQLIPEIQKYNTIARNHIEKHTFGNELWGEKFGYQDGGKTIEFELCGLCTDICVVSNALALRMFYPDAKITVDASCCAGVTPEKHAAALEVMKSCQIEVINE